MKVRFATEKDHEAVMAVQEANPDLQALNPYMAVNGPVLVAEENGEIVGVAIGRRTVEAFMYLKPGLSNYRKAKATKMLAHDGLGAMKEVGYCEAHAFTSNDGFAELMEGLPGARRDDRRHVLIDLTGEV